MDFEPHRNPATVKYEYSAVIILHCMPVAAHFTSGENCWGYDGEILDFFRHQDLFKTLIAAMIIQYCTFKTLEQEENVQRLGNSLQLF